MRVDFKAKSTLQIKALQGNFGATLFDLSLLFCLLHQKSIFEVVATSKIYKVMKTGQIKSFVLLVAKKIKSVAEFVANGVCELLKTKGLKTVQRCMFFDTVRTVVVVATTVCIGVQRFWCFGDQINVKNTSESRVLK